MDDVKGEAHWKLVERIVAVLEKLLTPASIVEHNQFLVEPATGNRRQCDVVVRTGRPPRQTITIVEVQDRGKKVDIGIYEGWCAKREKLGAQHLICVSATGFPESVQRDAALRGESVRLMTLCEPDDFPPFFQPRSILVQMDVLSDRDVQVVFDDYIPSEAERVRTDAQVFELEGRSGPISIMEIADKFLLQGLARDVQSSWITPQEQLRSYTLDFSASPYRLWLRLSEEAKPVVEARIVDKIEKHRYDIPLLMFAYEQIGIDGALAWAVVATGSHEGNDFVVRFPIIPLHDGRLRFGKVEYSAIPGLTIIWNATELVMTRKHSLQGPTQ